MPAFGVVDTPGDQLMWRQLIQKEKDVARMAPRSGFSLRGAVSREEVPVHHKPGHIDPQELRNCKGFDPKAHGWDPKGDLATEFRRCRKRATAPPTNRFLFPETTAQENGWCLKASKPQPRRASSLTALPVEAQRKQDAGGADKLAKAVTLEGEVVQRRRREREGDDAEQAGSKLGLGKWASESQLSAARPNGTELSALPPSMLSAAAPSCLSGTQLSRATASSVWVGVPKELVKRVREQDVKVEAAMDQARRYMCYGDRGNKHFYPLGETDATAYANAFMLATSGVPPHKWDPRSVPGKETGAAA